MPGAGRRQGGQHRYRWRNGHSHRAPTIPLSLAQFPTSRLAADCLPAAPCAANDIEPGGLLNAISRRKLAPIVSVTSVAAQVSYVARNARIAPRKGPDEDQEGTDDRRAEGVQRICRLASVPVLGAHSMRGLHTTLAMDAGITGRWSPPAWDTSTSARRRAATRRAMQWRALNSGAR